VHALYGFTRYADEIVDSMAHLPVEERAASLSDWSERFVAGLRGADVDDPLLPAVLHTIAEFGLDTEDFAAFLRSMSMDLTVTSYATYDDLLDYMEGSAAVIGTMMLPILGADDPVAAREPARQLGLAFQLTNFIRDVGEDLDRGRLYLPVEDLDRFGVTRDHLAADAARGTASGPVTALIEYEAQRAREHYAAAAPGVTMLAPASQACIRAAYHLYGGILDEVASAGYDVFRRRAVVPRARRLRVALRCVLTPVGTPVSTHPGAAERCAQAGSARQAS
jgi:phytoene synthase